LSNEKDGPVHLSLLDEGVQVGSLVIRYTGAEFVPVEDAEGWTLHGVHPDLMRMLVGWSFDGTAVATVSCMGRNLERTFERPEFRLGRWESGLEIVSRCGEWRPVVEPPGPADALDEAVRELEARDLRSAGWFLCRALRSVFGHLVPEHCEPVGVAVEAVEAWLRGEGTLESCHRAVDALDSAMAAELSVPPGGTLGNASFAVCNAALLLAGTCGLNVMGSRPQTSPLDHLLDAEGYAAGNPNIRNSCSMDARHAHATHLLAWLPAHPDPGVAGEPA